MTDKEVKTVYVSSSNIGKVLQLEDGYYYLDIAKNPFTRQGRAFMIVDKNGKLEVVFENMRWRNYVIKSETEGVPPARTLHDFTVFVETPQVPLNEAYEIAKDVLKNTVVFRDGRQYDLVTAWCLYTWVRGIFPKNVNMYFFGFPATGKSQALKFCKLFARYAVDYDPSAEKSYKWNISSTLGVIAIDEAEYISKVQAAKLRKYHEANVVETRVIGLPVFGLTAIDLRVDAPLVLSATHPPADTAFLQRGLIVRMYKGSPQIKDFDLISDLDFRRLVFAKSAITSWYKVFEAMNKVFAVLTTKNIDERIKDLALPVCTILEALGREWDWVIDYARYSFAQANFITPETTAFVQALLYVKGQSKLVGDRYILPVDRVSEIVRTVANVMGASMTKMDYLRQYLFAGCEVRIVDGGLCYVCDKETVDSLIADVSMLELNGKEARDMFVYEAAKTATLLIRSTLRALALYIKENVDGTNGVIEVSVKDLRPYYKGTTYFHHGYGFLSKRLANAMPIPWFKDIGLEYIYDGRVGKFRVDLSKIRHIIDFLTELCGGRNEDST